MAKVDDSAANANECKCEQLHAKEGKGEALPDEVLENDFDFVEVLIDEAGDQIQVLACKHCESDFVISYYADCMSNYHEERVVAYRETKRLYPWLLDEEGLLRTELLDHAPEERRELEPPHDLPADFHDLWSGLRILSQIEQARHWCDRYRDEVLWNTWRSLSPPSAWKRKHLQVFGAQMLQQVLFDMEQRSSVNQTHPGWLSTIRHACLLSLYRYWRTLSEQLRPLASTTIREVAFCDGWRLLIAWPSVCQILCDSPPPDSLRFDFEHELRQGYSRTAEGSPPREEPPAPVVRTEPMTQNDLCRHFGVGRTKMAEMLKELRAEGKVKNHGKLIRLPVSEMPPDYFKTKGITLPSDDG